jgi:hypothetical protein
MKTTIKVYNSHNKPNLGSTELEIYDVIAGVKSHSTFYTELKDDANNIEKLNLQGYQSLPGSVFIKN